MSYIRCMKLRNVLILFMFSGLFLISCQKQNFAPNAAESTVPTWQEDSTDNARMITETDDTDPTHPNPPTDNITDPNSDPDGDKSSKTRKN